MQASPSSIVFDLPPTAQAHRCLAELPLRAWPIGERPVERLIASGPAALSDAELLAVLLGGGRSNPVALAQQLIQHWGSWQGLRRWTCAHALKKKEPERDPPELIGRFFPSFKTCNCENRRPDTHLIVYPAALFSPHTTCTCQCDGVLAPTNVTGEEFGRLPPCALTG